MTTGKGTGAFDDAFESWPTAIVIDGARQELPDPVAVEEPLEILVESARSADGDRDARSADGDRDARSADGTPAEPLVVTLRTPGHDAELAAGFLYAEGLVDAPGDLLEIRDSTRCGVANRVVVRLRRPAALAAARAARAFLSTAACGVCGKTSIGEVFARGLPALERGRPRIIRSWLESLPERMRAAQPVFARTGGLHAAALFDAGGELVVLREDVGRHNAVDKVIGERLLAGALGAERGLADAVLLLSGRAGFEIVQKAARAGIPLVAAVGAPSSLSLRVAERTGMTLVGFLRRGRFNLYTGLERVV